MYFNPLDAPDLFDFIYIFGNELNPTNTGGWLQTMAPTYQKALYNCRFLKNMFY